MEEPRLRCGSRWEARLNQFQALDRPSDGSSGQFGVKESAGVGLPVFNQEAFEVLPCTASGVGRGERERLKGLERLRAALLHGCKVDSISHASLLSRGLPKRMCLLELGCIMLQLTLTAPRDGKFLQAVIDELLKEKLATPYSGKGDLGMFFRSLFLLCGRLLAM